MEAAADTASLNDLDPPPPPPTTPPDYIDPAKEEIANERALAKAET